MCVYAYVCTHILKTTGTQLLTHLEILCLILPVLHSSALLILPKQIISLPKWINWDLSIDLLSRQKSLKYKKAQNCFSTCHHIHTKSTFLFLNIGRITDWIITMCICISVFAIRLNIPWVLILSIIHLPYPWPRNQKWDWFVIGTPQLFLFLVAVTASALWGSQWDKSMSLFFILEFQYIPCPPHPCALA